MSLNNLTSELVEAFWTSKPLMVSILSIFRHYKAMSYPNTSKIIDFSWKKISETNILNFKRVDVFYRPEWWTCFHMEYIIQYIPCRDVLRFWLQMRINKLMGTKNWINVQTLKSWNSSVRCARSTPAGVTYTC